MTENSLVPQNAESESRLWRRVLAGGLSGVLLSAIYTFVVPPVYESRVSLIFPPPSILSQTNPFDESTPPSNILMGVVLSDRSMKEIAAAGKVNIEDARQMFSAQSDPATNQLVLSARSRDPNQILAMVETAEKNLTKLNREVGFSVGTNQAANLLKVIKEREAQRELLNKKLSELQSSSDAPVDVSRPETTTFYQQALKDTEFELGTVQQRLKSLQRTLGNAERIGDVPLELSPNAALLKSQMLAAELDYKSKQATLGEKHPLLLEAQENYRSAKVAFENEVRAVLKGASANLTEGLITLKAKEAVLKSQRDYWRTLSEQAPVTMIEALRVSGEIASLNQVILGLRKQYDAAVLQAEVDRYRWTLIAPPRVLPDPINKNYPSNAIVGLVLGAGLIFALSSASPRGSAPSSDRK